MLFHFSIMCSTIQSESEWLQMSTFSVTRAQLKTACDQNNWDLLDKLLEEQAVNRQGEILNETGLLFQTTMLKSDDKQDT